MKALRRGFAAALAAAMVVTAAPSAVFAEEVNETVTEVVEASENAEITDMTAEDTRTTSDVAETDIDQVAADNDIVAENDSDNKTEESDMDVTADTDATADAVVNQLAAAGDTIFTFGSTKVLDSATVVSESTAYPTGEESKTPVKTVGSITINEAAGYNEGMYAEWAPVAGADGYIVYVSSSQDGPWDAIDNELVRQYPTYYRADALGLAAGEYYMKIAAVTVSGDEVDEENPVAYAILKCTVTATDRSGFAFTNGMVPGAYNADGTLKSDAVVVYVNNGNFDSVVTTVKDSSGNEVSFTGVQDLVNNSGWWKTTSKPLCIRILGTIDSTGFPSSSWGSSSEGLQVKCAKTGQSMNFTLEGVGDDATIKNFGVFCRSTQAVELKNFAVMLCKDDCISLDTDNYYTWVHNIDFYYGGTGGDADQAKGDGSLDVKGNSKYQTYSYNHFIDSGKCSLCGMKSESGPNYLTYHHNWFDHSDSRHPRIRTMSVHIYNNYYDGNSKYGVGVTTGADAFVESNYFRNCQYPMMSSLQGNDVYAGSATYDVANNKTFSSEKGGSIKSYNNIMLGDLASFAPYNNSKMMIKGGIVDSADYFDTATHFDAYDATTRTEEVPSTMIAFSGSDTYSNFDTTVDLGVDESDITAVEDVPAVVTKYAGRLSGGDFKYPISDNDTNDADHEVDTTLKAQMTAYTTSLVSVGGVSGSGIAQTVTVTIDPANGEAKTTQTVAKGDTIAQPSTPATTASVADKTFEGWYIGNTKVTFPYTATSTCTITAKWLGKKVTVTYMDGDTILGTDDIESGATASSTLYTQKDNAVFQGWYADSALTTAFDFTQAIEADTKIYGSWKTVSADDIVTLTIDYGSDFDEVTADYVKGDSVSEPESKTRLGYELKGWYEKSTGDTVTFPFTITADTTIVADWKEKEVYYTVTVDPNNGDAAVEQQIKKGTLFEMPSFSNGDYMLEGFYDNTGAKLIFPIEITKNLTMVAKWINADGSSVQSEDLSLVYDDYKSLTLTQDATVTKTGEASSITFSINGNSNTDGHMTIDSSKKALNTKHTMGYLYSLGTDNDVDSCSISFTIPGSGPASIIVTGYSSKSRNLVLSKDVDGTITAVEKKALPTSSGKLTFTVDTAGKYYVSTEQSAYIQSVEVSYDVKVDSSSMVTATFMDGDDVIATDSIIPGMTFNAPGASKKGFTLKGWKKSGETTLVTFPATAGTTDMVFEAVWEADSSGSTDPSDSSDDEETLPLKLVLAHVDAAALGKKGAVPEIKLYYSPDGVIDEDYRLVEGEDYTLKLKNNKAVYDGDLPEFYDKASKAPLATITGKNNFKFTKYVYFNIVADGAATGCSLDSDGIDISMPAEVTFCKGGVTPKVRIYDDGVLLRNGTDYTIKYSNNKTIGNGLVTIKGKGIYTGTVTKTFAITSKDISEVVVVAADKANKNSTTAKTTIKVLDVDGKALTAGRDYDKNIKLYYNEETDVVCNGSALTREAGSRVDDKDKISGSRLVKITAVITAQYGSGYEGETSVTYALSPVTLKGVKGTFKTVQYAGDKTTVTKDDVTAMKLGKTQLTYGDDYVFDQNSYTLNGKKGTASVNIVGKGDYAGLTARVTFKITEKTTIDADENLAQ